MKRAVVFIDGGNFYFRLRDLTSTFEDRPSLLSFPFMRFCDWLVRPHQLVAVHYYIGALKRQRGNQKSEKMYADQQKLIATLREQKVSVILGHVIQHPDKSYHEKGVDVRIAVEMIRLAREDRYDVAYLVSSDTDLVPAVEEVRLLRKEVCYTGFSRSQSFGLTKASSDTRLIRSEEVLPFFTKSEESL
ncbi:MAG: NYN domain-containing protein [bacterium]|nr:NYN domain-containing protein [bacterium]